MSAFAPLSDGSHLVLPVQCLVLQSLDQNERLVGSICCKTPSEVTLGAKLQVDRVLVLELVPRGRLRRRRTENRRALEFLIEVDP
jgi:hypothetical protein